MVLAALGTGVIVAIVVVAVVLLLLIALMPRLRARRSERRLQARRDEVAAGHREDAQNRRLEADLAAQEAERKRAEADVLEKRAELHEQGLADDELPDREGVSRDG